MMDRTHGTMLCVACRIFYIITLSRLDAVQPSLLVTSLDFSNDTSTNINNNTSNLKVANLDLNNHTAQANRTFANLLPTSTTTAIKVADDSSKSEIYKMNNGLMLLHAQRGRLGPEAKKSVLLQETAGSSINYHVRSRVKGNDSTTSFAEQEKTLEAKLGNLPQVHQKKRSAGLSETSLKFKAQPIIEKQRKQALVSREENGLYRRKVNRPEIKHRWKSVVQGENQRGGTVKKSQVYPMKLLKHERDSYRGVLDVLSDESMVGLVKPTTAFKLLNKDSEKHKRLRRALSMMGSLSEDEPLFDSDQPEENLKRDYERRALHMRKKQKKLGSLHNRGLANDIQAIQPIPDIRQSFDKIKPLEPYPRFPEFHTAIGHYPRFGVPELKLMNFPQFGAPKMDEFENIPGIPHIKPLSRGDEVTGDRRGFKVDNEFYDEDLDDSIEHIERAKEATAPTSIPYLTDIPSITDIPDIKPIPAAAGKSTSVTGGVNGKMPVMQTVDTDNGKETQVSA